MEVVILKTDGTAVALDSSFTDKAFDIEGFLLEFNFTNNVSRRFKYYQKNDFKLADREKYTSLSGYYVEGKYLSYMQGLESDSPNIEDLKSKFLFQFDKYKSKAGNPIKVSVVDLGEPYSRYYNNVDYTFSIENLESSNTPRKYLKSIYEGVVKIGYEIDIPSNAVKNVIERTPLKLATRYFYNNNYTRYLGVWNSDVTKHNIKKIATLISFRIAEIEREIFPKLANSSTWGMLEAIADSPNGSIDSLNDFQKMLFILKKTWGYYHDPSADESYVHKHDFEPVFSVVPGYEDYVNYYNNLTGFYYSLYKIQDKLLNVSEDLRLRYLLQTLPVSALTIVPYSIIKNQLSGYSQIKELPENSQRFIVHLVISITKRLEYADDFLDFLLKKEDGVVTIFEVLYHLLNDARLERLSIVNWFVDEQTNRKYYAYAIFELWKVSKYNWEYFPSTNTSNLDSVNLSSYFFSNAKELNKDNILEFDAIYKSVLNTSTSSVSNKTVKYYTSIDGKSISISNLILSIVKDKFGIRDGGYSTPKFGDFHLYHPISLIGYQSNLDLTIPQKTLIPAFLFHFAEEYDRLADFDAQLSLGIDVAVDIALFFATGGVGVLRDLKYLKYVTKLGQALRGKLAATEAVVVWRASEISAEIITFTASTIANYNQYLITTENDPEKRKHHQKIQWIILGLLFVSAVGTAYSRIKAVKEANEVLELMSKFPGATHGVPPGLVELLETLAGKRAVLTSKMGSKLQTLKNEGIAVDNVIAKYNGLTDKQKYRFFEHFGEINDRSIWRELNFFQGQPIDNWLILSEKNIMEAKIIAFITKPKRVNAILKYYDEPSLRKILESFDYQSRLKILDEFGKPNWMNDAVLFERIIEKPSSLNLIRIFQNSAKTGLDVFSFEDVIAIVKTEFKNVTIDYLSIKSTMILKDVVKRYGNGSEIVKETMELGRLRSLYDGTATDFNNIFSAITPDFLSDFYSSNKLVAKTEVYKNNSLIKFVTEKFISGKESQVLQMFGGNLPVSLTEPLYSKFNVFNKKAIDFIPKNRRNDTEIKYIFNFLENHWDDGDRFVIQLESTFYACQSCQGYLVYLKELARKAGKTVDIKVIAVEAISGTSDLIDKLN